MKVGDLVLSVLPLDLTDEWPLPGLVIAVNRDYYGARQAFKIYQDIPRGCCIRPNMVDGIGPTKDGIRDRVLVHWPDAEWSYHDSKDIEVISESR